MIDFQKIQTPLDEIAQTVKGLLSDAYGEFEDEDVKEDIESVEYSLNEFKKRFERAKQADLSTLSEMAHDLRGPFNSIIGYPEMLLEDPLEPEQLTAIRSIYDTGSFLIGQINGVLDYARIETDTLKANDCIHFDLVAEIKNQQGVYMEQRERTFDVEDNLPKAYGDSYQIRRSFLSLLENAIVYSDAPVTIAAKTNDGMIEVSVKDTGTGIKADDIAHIFEPFWTGESESKRMGLGLYLAKQFIQKNNGTIRVESVVGEGSTFTMTVPTQA